MPANSPYDAIKRSDNGRRLTYFPTVNARSWAGLNVAVNVAWAPCVYDEAAAETLSLPLDPRQFDSTLPVPVRRELVEELAPQIHNTLLIGSIENRIEGGAEEAALSIAHVDGIGDAFCHCNGCVFALALNHGRWMYRGASVTNLAGQSLTQGESTQDRSDVPIEEIDGLTLRGLHLRPRPRNGVLAGISSSCHSARRTWHWSCCAPPAACWWRGCGPTRQNKRPSLRVLARDRGLASASRRPAGPLSAPRSRPV